MQRQYSLISVVIMLLITDNTNVKSRGLSVVKYVINNIITTPQDAIINRENRGRIPVSDYRTNYRNTRLREHRRHPLEV